MTEFDKIDCRLALLPFYEGYRAENWECTPWGRHYTYVTTGIVFMYKLLTFYEWLAFNGYEELV